MTAGKVTLGLIALAAFYTITLGGISYAARTDPYRVDYARVAIHGNVIYPYGGG